MPKITQIATAFAVIGMSNMGQPAFARNTVCIDDAGNAWELETGITPKWKRLPDLPDTITELKEQRPTLVKAN